MAVEPHGEMERLDDGGDARCEVRASSSSRPGDCFPAAAFSQTFAAAAQPLTYEACSSSCSPFPAPVISPDDLASASPREVLLVTLSRLTASSTTDYREYWALFSDNAWCNEVWRQAACRVAHRNPALRPSPDDIAQAAAVALGRLLRGKEQLFLWLAEPGAQFPDFFRGLARRLCLAAARSLRQEALGGGKLRRRFVSGEQLAAVPDQRRSESEIAEENEHVQARMGAFPQPTRDVVQLRADGLTWEEIAERLDITVKAAKYAYHAWINEIRSAFRDDK